MDPPGVLQQWPAWEMQLGQGPKRNNAQFTIVAGGSPGPVRGEPDVRVAGEDSGDPSTKCVHGASLSGRPAARRTQV